MDTTKRNREEKPRMPKGEVPSDLRKQPGASQRRQRPEETPQRPQRPEGASQRPQRPEGTPQRSRRPGGTSQRSEETSQRPRPEGRQAASQDRQPADPRRRREQASQPSQQRGEAASQLRRQQSGQRPAARQGADTERKRQAAKAPPKASSGSRKGSRRPESPDDLSSKKRAYGNSKPKRKSSLSVLGKAVAATAKESAARRNERLVRQGKRSKNDAKQPLPAVIYTQPQAFNRDRLVVQLVTVAAVVAAFVIGLSVFFKVENIRVSGAEVYTAWAIQEASGIKEGDSLLTFSRTRAGAQIKANLPYVKDVSFGIRLPDTVNIIIREEDVVYAIKDQDEQWWLMNSDGRVVAQAKKGQASNYTQILGVALEHPMREQLAVAVENKVAAQNPEPDPTAETEEVVVPVNTVSGAQKLDIALQIVKALEDNDIVGEAASVNVSQTQGITLWYGTRYQINLGDSENLAYKIACMNSAIMTMQDYDSGVLDCSFKVWPDQVGYTPFS